MSEVDHRGATEIPPEPVRLFVANIDFSATVDDLRDLFSQHGPVLKACIISDYLGRSRGFGFLTMATREGAARAVSSLNDSLLGARRLFVEAAREKVVSTGASKSTKTEGKTRAARIGGD